MIVSFIGVGVIVVFVFVITVVAVVLCFVCITVVVSVAVWELILCRWIRGGLEGGEQDRRFRQRRCRFRLRRRSRRCICCRSHLVPRRRRISRCLGLILYQLIKGGEAGGGSGIVAFVGAIVFAVFAVFHPVVTIFFYIMCLTVVVSFAFTVVAIGFPVV